METPEDLQISSTEEIEKQLKSRKMGKVIELPSGIKVRVARPSMFELMRKDIIPTSLVDAAIKVDSNEFKVKSKEDILKFADVIAVTVCSAVTEPKLVTENPKGNEILMADLLNQEDQLYIFNYTQTGVADLRPFRQQQEGIDAGSSSKKVSRETPKPDDGNS